MFAFVRNALRRRPAPTDTANINTTAEAPAAGAFSLLRSLRSRWPLPSLLPPPLLQAFATRRVVFVALFALAALGAAAALTLWPAAAGQTASAQGSAPPEECHDLHLDMYRDSDSRYFTVANGNDEETIANVMVKLKFDNAVDDDRTSQWVRGRITTFSSNYGTVWISDAPDNIIHWRLPAVPPGTSYRAAVGKGGNPGQGLQRVGRNTVTMEQRVPGAETALCRTEREFWTLRAGHALTMFTSAYSIGELSVDNLYPAPGGNVNFKVVGDSQKSVAASVKVRHTSGLEFQTNASPVIKPDPTGGRTEPLAVWQNYDAARGVGEFYIGNEGVTKAAERTEISITLPLKLKQGVKADGQCVTATITAMPKVANPNAPGENYDDPADNTQTLCLGKPPAAELPVLLTEGLAQLFTLYGCVGKMTYPCDSTDTVEQVVGGKDAAVNAGLPYRYFQPEDVVVHIPDPVGRNKPTDETGIFWWSGSEEGSQGKTYHPGQLPGVAVRTYFECLTDKDPNNSPSDDPEYKGWKFSIANITDSSPGQGNTIDHTPGAMIIGSLLRANDRTRTYVDVDASHGNRRTEVEFATYKLCTRSIHLIVEFDQLGTYKADLTQQTKYQDANTTAYSDTGRYTFHVGPVAELSVADGGDVPALASGQTAYTLDLSNHGPDPSVAAKVVVKLPAGATGVATVPANLGTFHAAGTTAGVAHGPYWIWNAGKLLQSDFSRVAGRPQGGVVSLIVTGVTSGATATATVSNGNGSCSVSSTTLTHVIREADCKAVTGATWTKANPYTVCIDTDHDRLIDVTPKPANQTACEATTGNKWYAGTVYDHRPGNNTATLTARTAAGAGLSGSASSRSLPTVALNWPAAAGASQYRVFRSTTGALGSYRQIKVVDEKTLTYTDENVAASTTYYYQVEALYPNRRLAEIYATSATATLTATTPRAPGAVGGLTAARQTNDENTIDVSWRAPSNATAATRYDVHYQTRTGNSGNWPDTWTSGAVEQAGLAYTITEAGGGTSYRIRVRSVTVVGMDSYPGSWSSATVRAVSAPNQVGNLMASRKSNDATTIDVSWSAPSGGTAPSRYEVEYREGSGAWLPDTTPVSQTGLTYTHNNAKGASTYQFRVRPVTVSGGDTIYGGWAYSNTVSKVSNPDQVTGLSASRQSDNETVINVSWSAPSGGTTPTGYELQSREGNGAWLPDTPVSQTGLTYTQDDAKGASTYQFRVRAFKTLTTTGEKLTGSWRTSGTVSRVGVPNRVTGLTATRSDTDETKITVTWTAPSSGDTPTGYDVEYKQDGGNTWNTGTTVTHPTVTHTFTVAGGSSYQYRVRAFRTLTSTNEKLEGSWTTSGTVRGLPAGPVTNLTATRNTTDKTTIDVSWSASNRATGYDVQYRKNNGGWSTGASKQTGLTYTQTDAGGVETYQFRVRGVSGAGNGDWTESGTVDPPPLEWQGYEVGPTVADGKMAWITLKMASGPWWYEYRNHVADWSSCKRVAAGSHTITGLRAPIMHIVEIFDAAGCNDGDRIRRENITTVDVPDQILDRADFNYHTHKRPYPELGELGVKPADCFDLHRHTHSWPDGGNGWHWHCPIYR